MTAKVITALTLENALKKNVRPPKRIEIPDGGCRCLYLITQPSGAKSWAIRYRYGGKPKKLTLGPLLTLAKGEKEPKPELDRPLTLSGARFLATTQLNQVKQQIEPAAQKQQDKAARRKTDAQQVADSVAALSQRILDNWPPKKKSKQPIRESYLKQVKQIFESEIKPAWKGRSVHSITRRDVLDLLNKIAKDRPAMANRVLAVIRKFFNWMVNQDILPASPLAKAIEPPGAENPRDRVLSKDEIRAFWHGSDDLPKPFDDWFKLLFVTGGQRRSEVAGMRRTELDLEQKLWTLPKATFDKDGKYVSRTKNGLMHKVPLTPQALAIINKQPRIKDCDYVFTTTGKSHISGFSDIKEALDKVVKPQQPWQFRDIRRTADTLMGDDLSIEPHIVEAIQNRISGFKPGVAAVYNKAEYVAQKRAALEAWADHLDKITDMSDSANVVKLKQRSGKRR